MSEDLGMGIVRAASRARADRRVPQGAGRVRFSYWLGVCLCVAGVGLGCSRSAGVVLPLDASIPEQFPKSTTLDIGDPTVQLQLRLTGGLDALPFTPHWQNISGGPQTIEAFRAGVLDGGSIGDTPPIHALFTGPDVKIITVQVRTKPAFQLALAPGVSAASNQALRGKRIAYSPGQAQGALVLRVLAQAGLSRDDVHLVEILSSEFTDALGSRQVDAAPLGGTNLRRYLREYGPDGGSSIPHGVADGYSFFYVRASTLGEPDKAAALREYARIRTRALLWQQQHAEWIESYYVKDLLLDEPFGALDALTRLRMHQLLGELCIRHEPAVLLVTHDVDEAIELADRVLLLDAGKIALDQRIELGAPRSRRSPHFLDYREALLAALGVSVPSPEEEASLGAPAPRTGRYSTRLERTA